MGTIAPAPPHDIAADWRQAAWRTAFLFSLDMHPDDEIAWEAARWRELGAATIAAICDDLLAERRADDFSIPGEVSPGDLDTLWRRMPQATALWWVRQGGACLVAALRLVFWLGAPPEELAA